MTKKAIQAEVQEDTIDLKEIMNAILNRKWVVLGCVLLAVLIGGFYATFRTPIYQTDLLLNVSSGSSNSLLSLLGSKSGSDSGSGGGGGFFGGNSTVTTEQDILTSRSVLEPVIQKLHLDVIVTPSYFPLIGKRMALNYNLINYANQIAPARFGTRSYSWGGTSLAVQQFNVSPYFQGQNFKVVYLGNNHYELYDKNGVKLATGSVGQTLQLQPFPYATISLMIENIQALPGMVFLIQQQKMPVALAELSTVIKAAPTEQYSNLLKVTLTGENPLQVTTILNAIGAQAVQNSINQTIQQATQILGFLRNRLPTAETGLNAAETALTQYRTKSGNVDLPGQTKVIMQHIAQVQNQLSQAQLHKVQLEQQYTDSSAPIQETNQGIAQYQQQIQQLELQLRSTPGADQILVTLTRNAIIQNAIYTSLLNNIQQYELIKAATVGDVTILDTATVPYQSINLSGVIVLAISAFLGLFVSVLYVFVRHFLWHGIENTDVLEQELELPVLSVLHESKTQQLQQQKLKKHRISHLKLLAEVDSQSIEVESLRSLRTNLLFKLKQKHGNVIVVTGPSPGIGKSFVTANLAHLLADSGQRVLLIDADMRRGALYHYFNVPPKPGLTDVLQGKATVDNVTHPTRIKGLDFIPTGAFVSHHGELLLQAECKSMLEHLSACYDVVLIDTAPILALSDAAIWGEQAAIRLLILAYSQHQQREVYYAMQQFEKMGQTLDGCILNRVPQRAEGNGYSYRYHYRAKQPQQDAKI